MKNESDLVRRIQLIATENGGRLFRNNVGQATTETGSIVRFGLHPGSGDLIGFHPVVITQAMVGKTIAVFTSGEVKMPGGKIREGQQLWHDMVQANGGISEILRSEEDYFQMIRKWLLRG